MMRLTSVKDRSTAWREGSGSEVSSTAKRSIVARSLAVALSAALPWAARSGSAAAQQTSGGISTTIPTLRGPVGEDGPQALPSATEGIGGAVTSADPDTGFKRTDDAARPKFGFPKGTAKTRDRTKVPRKGAPPLPSLQAYPTSARPKGGGAAIDTLDREIRPAPAVAALPVATRPRTGVEEKPFEPVGVDVGSLRLTPYVSQSLGYDSNPDQTQIGVRPSGFSRTEGGFGLLSNWSSSELKAAMHGAYNDYFDDPQANRPDAAGVVDLRLDVDRNSVIDAEQRFTVDTQRTNSPEVSGAVVGRPLITTFGTTLGGTETLGRLSLGLHGSFDRVAYDNAALAGGGLDDLASENYDDFGLRARVGYEITPALKPFVDLFVDHRAHDRLVDLSGFRRDSDGAIGQVGASFEFNRLFTGEASAGYGERTYADKRLRNLEGPVVNGAVSYAATPLTLITLRGATSFDETTVAGSSGAQSRSATFEVSHALLRNLTITGALSYLNTDYVGVPIAEDTLAETLKAEYHFSRALVGTATYSHEDLTSTVKNASFSQDVLLFGLRLQR